MSNPPLSVSLVQFEARPLDGHGNSERMVSFARQEAKSGAALIVFPELSNTGYVEPLVPGGPFHTAESAAEFCDRLYANAVSIGDETTRTLSSIAVSNGCSIVAGLAVRHPVLRGVLENASVLFAPDGQISYYSKLHRWHNEKLYFQPGNDINVWPLPFGTLGMQICYDIRFPELTRIMTDMGATVITNIWAAFGGIDDAVEDENLFIHRIYTRAVENGIFMVSCNRAGIQGDCRFHGRSAMVSPFGKVIAASQDDSETIVRGSLNLEEVVQYRTQVGILSDRRPDVYARYRK
jgi:omega-amidase